VKLTKAQRAEVKAKFDGRCAYCGEQLGERWHADHMAAVVRSPVMWDDDQQKLVPRPSGMIRPHNDKLENMLPSCVPCNLYKATFDLEGFRQLVEETVGVLSRNSTTYRHARRFGLVQETSARVTFYFERVGKICELETV
jgi:hypothetical protein